VARPPAPDIALAVAFAVVAEIELHLASQNTFRGTVSSGSDSLLVLLPVVPLAWRRVYPFAALAAVAGVIVVVGAGVGGSVLFFGGLFPFLLALYSASLHARSPLDRFALAFPLLLVGPMPLWAHHFRVPGDYVFASVLSLLAWLIGQVVRRWQHQSARLSGALLDAQRGREAATGLAVAQERARIARELHDIVAHSLGIIVLQSSAARIGAEGEIATTLGAIEDTGRRAMAEMRRLLGVMRRDEDLPLGPPPGLDSLPHLLNQFRGAGLNTEILMRGTPRDLPVAHDMTAFRILQEALTNALRHGRDGSARLELDYLPSELRLCISNPTSEATPALEPGRPSDGLPGGHGLIGIKERVALFGGTCRISQAGHRFETEVLLPIETTK
jgi:signal transduction histidine kinase